MPELHDIIGSLLRDISQARVSSDLYTRNISRYYEQDALLRKFPLPRTEIDEVEIDIPFALNGIGFNPLQDESRESSLATLMVSLADDIMQRYFQIMPEHVDALGVISEEDQNYLIGKLNGTEYRIYLRQDILRYLQHSQSQWIKKEKFQVDEIRKAIEEEFEKRILHMFEELEISPEQQQGFIEKVNQSVSFDHFLEEFTEEAKPVLEAMGDLKVQVEVTANRLQDLPEELISKIKIKSSIRNYLWSKVDHEGNNWFSLNPE